MEEERYKILEMVAAGIISAEEGERLLAVLENAADDQASSQPAAAPSAKDSESARITQGGAPMLPDDLDYLARKERQKELLREVETEQLRRKNNEAAEKSGQLHRKAANWIGTQMVRLGSELQRYSDDSPADATEEEG